MASAQPNAQPGAPAAAALDARFDVTTAAPGGRLADGDRDGGAGQAADAGVVSGGGVLGPPVRPARGSIVGFVPIEQAEFGRTGTRARG